VEKIPDLTREIPSLTLETVFLIQRLQDAHTSVASAVECLIKSVTTIQDNPILED
jgi:hypothetical protein